MKLWDPRGIKLFMDISTYCNAGCPQCHRTNPKGLDKVDWLPLIQWSLEDFKRAFSEEDLDLISHFHFCGTWGDPMMIKEIIPIMKYVMQNSMAFISIDTNGAMRNEDFWWDLGVLVGKRMKITFDVDGINQEMHSMYRRKTELSKVLTHMEIMSQTNVHIESQTVLFKHNADYKDEIIELVKKHGSKHHKFVVSDRFGNPYTGGVRGNNDITWHEDEKGNEFILERAPSEVVPKGFISGTNTNKLSDKIKCRWAMPRNEIVINSDGQVLPCCYHQNAYYWGSVTEQPNDLLRSQPYEYYLKNKQEFNIFHNSLTDILNSKWYAEDLPNSMSNENVIRTCERNCSNRSNKIPQLRENHAT